MWIKQSDLENPMVRIFEEDYRVEEEDEAYLEWLDAEIDQARGK